MSADLAMAADPAAVERAADPAAFIVDACERAKSWLAVVLEQGDIESIVECKSQAEAIRVYTMSRQLGKDAQLSATEIVRRAERGIGVAIRRGQEQGTIRDRGNPSPKVDQVENSPPSPTDYATKGELYGGGNGGKVGIYALTDGVSNEDFEEALAEARGEGNLTRSNLVRKIQRPVEGEWIPASGDKTAAAALRRRELIAEMAADNYSSRQIGGRLGILDMTIRRIARECRIEIPADAIVGKTRALNSNRIVRETVNALEGLAMGAQLADLADVDPSEAGDWAASLTDSIRVLNRLVRSLKEIAQP